MKTLKVLFAVLLGLVSFSCSDNEETLSSKASSSSVASADVVRASETLNELTFASEFMKLDMNDSGMEKARQLLAMYRPDVDSVIIKRGVNNYTLNFFKDGESLGTSNGVIAVNSKVSAPSRGASMHFVIDNKKCTQRYVVRR